MTDDNQQKFSPMGKGEKQLGRAEGSISAVVTGYAPRCHECANRERFDNGKKTALYLCMAQPYEEDEQFGILTWLDTANFESGHCLNFKKRPACTACHNGVLCSDCRLA